MKYYKHKKDNDKKLLKLRIKEYSKTERKNYIINKVLSKICVALFFVEFVIIFLLAKNMKNIIDNKIVANILSIILYILLLPLPLALTIFVILIINRIFIVAPLSKVKNDMIIEVNKNKIEYYGLTKNYIVTKCYNSSHKELEHKDVLVCYCKGKIKITNDFYHSIFDFGCYEFDLNEIEYFNIKDGNLIKTKVSFDNETFILGYRAKTFIDNNKYLLTLNLKQESYDMDKK